jgi:superfamily II DNA helicase RecQ
VGITRGRHRVVVLTDRSRPSPFVAEIAGTAPRRPARGASTRSTAAAAPSARSAKGRSATAADKGSSADGIVAAEGHEVKVLGGYSGVIVGADGRGVQVRLDNGGTLAVRYGERVEQRGRTAPLAPPVELWGEAAAAEEVLRRWRSARAKADGVPAYVVLSDAHVRGIALARPADAEGLVACDGIGPTKLDRYGDDILAQLDTVTGA